MLWPAMLPEYFPNTYITASLHTYTPHSFHTTEGRRTHGTFAARTFMFHNEVGGGWGKGGRTQFRDHVVRRSMAQQGAIASQSRVYYSKHTATAHCKKEGGGGGEGRKSFTPPLQSTNCAVYEMKTIFANTCHTNQLVKNLIKSKVTFRVFFLHGFIKITLFTKQDKLHNCSVSGRELIKCQAVSAIKSTRKTTQFTLMHQCLFGLSLFTKSSAFVTYCTILI